jgi:hypothetical protein
MPSRKAIDNSIRVGGLAAFKMSQRFSANLLRLARMARANRK